MVEIPPSLELDCTLIDNDHKQLVAMVNHIVAHIDSDKTDECPSLVAEFIDFAKGHFIREEALLDKLDYPGADNHGEFHKTLNQKMDEILVLSKGAPSNKLAAQTLRKELIFFIMDDVINTDLDFKDYLDKKRSEGEDI